MSVPGILLSYAWVSSPTKSGSLRPPKLPHMIRIALFLPAIFFENMTLQRMHQNFQICGPGHSSWKRKVKYDNSGSCSLVMPSAKKGIGFWLFIQCLDFFLVGVGGLVKISFKTLNQSWLKKWDMKTDFLSFSCAKANILHIPREAVQCVPCSKL